MQTEEIGDQLSTDPFIHQHLHFTDHASWYEAIYTSADGDASKVPWAKMGVTPILANWLAYRHPGGSGKRALVVGAAWERSRHTLMIHNDTHRAIRKAEN